MQQATDKLHAEALQRFGVLLEKAKAERAIHEPTAMSLATVDGSGQPSVRVVLLKAFDARGFVFYTNTLSQKGKELAVEPRAALCFHWQPLMQQVRLEGPTGAVSAAEADAYWASRIRISQIGAWASLQSEEMPDREALDRRFAEFEQKFAGKPVPRPPHWSGYRLQPRMIEFWSSKEGRLHERERYLLGDTGWRHAWVFP